jgi:hypothetical protein
MAQRLEPARCCNAYDNAQPCPSHLNFNRYRTYSRAYQHNNDYKHARAANAHTYIYVYGNFNRSTTDSDNYHAHKYANAHKNEYTGHANEYGNGAHTYCGMHTGFHRRARH